MVDAASAMSQQYQEFSSTAIELVDCLIKKMNYSSEILLKDIFEDQFLLYGFDLTTSQLYK